MNVACYFRKRKSVLQQIEEFTSTLSIPITTARPPKKKEKLEEGWRHWVAGAALGASTLGHLQNPNVFKKSVEPMLGVTGFSPSAGDYINKEDAPPPPLTNREIKAKEDTGFNWEAWNREMEQVPDYTGRMVWQPRKQKDIAAH